MQTVRRSVFESPRPVPKVLFVCDGRYALAQSAEQMMHLLAGSNVQVDSAVVDVKSGPGGAVRLRCQGSDLSPLPVECFSGSHYDIVVTLSREACDTWIDFAGQPLFLHWDLTGESGSSYGKGRIAGELNRRIQSLLRCQLRMTRFPLREAIAWEGALVN